MKNLFLIFILLSLISCGKDDGEQTPAVSACGMPAEFLGTWHNVSRNDTLTVNSNCRTTATYCESSGLIIPVNGQPNRFLFHILSNNGRSDCSAIGIYSCAYQINDVYLTVNCGGGVATYQR